MNAEEVAADLLSHGSIEVQEFGVLKVGSRVRHSGQRWPEAFTRGTGTIERIFHKPQSRWEQQYGRPDVELIVRRDSPSSYPGDPYMFVADYHIELAEKQTA